MASLVPHRSSYRNGIASEFSGLIFRQIDFFATVGAPEEELDSLQKRLKVISPGNVGYYIEMSKKHGMDGGWFLIGDYPFSTAADCQDEGDPKMKILGWTQNPFNAPIADETLKIERCHFFGRDIGSTPPRQSEVRVILPGKDFEEQLNAAHVLYDLLGVPHVPENEVALMRQFPPVETLTLTIISVGDQPVQLGLCVPKPPEDLYVGICQIYKVQDPLKEYQLEMGFLLPSCVEFRYLMVGFGYSVYVEGHTTHFHYNVRICFIF